jgi:hypothetical protein
VSQRASSCHVRRSQCLLKRPPVCKLSTNHTQGRVMGSASCMCDNDIPSHSGRPRAAEGAICCGGTTANQKRKTAATLSPCV